MTLALDGSAASNGGGASSGTITLTTSNANDEIAVVALVNDFVVSSISDVAGLSWAKRTAAPTGTGHTLELWYAKSTGILTADVITVNFTGGSSFFTLCAFGISGGNTASPLDSSGSLPATGTTSAVAVTTSNANDFLIGAYRFASIAAPTAGAGWTAITGANFLLVEYQVVSATQSGLSVAIGTGNTDENSGIGDALVAGAAAPVTPQSGWFMPFPEPGRVIQEPVATGAY